MVAENKLGRLLHPGEVVHHVDEDKTNDAPDNLEVISGAKHARHHALERAPAPIQVTCGWCKSPFSVGPAAYRRRSKNSQSGYMFCSRNCSSKFFHH